MTPELAAVLADGYTVFRRASPRDGLGVCTCPMCLSADVQKRLMTRNLRSMSSALLREYTYAADGADISSMSDGLHFLVPRLLDLLAHDEELHFSDPSLALRRLKMIDFRRRWSASEVEIVDRFYDAYLSNKVRAKTEDGAWRNDGSLETPLVLAAIGGANLQRVFQTIEFVADPAAALHVAMLRKWVRRDGKQRFTEPFLNDDPDAQGMIGGWLMGPIWTRRIEMVAPLTHADLGEIVMRAVQV